MNDCPKCKRPVDGLFCSYCDKQIPWRERHPIPSHVRVILDEIKAKGRRPAPMREPGEEG